MKKLGKNKKTRNIDWYHTHTHTHTERERETEDKTGFKATWTHSKMFFGTCMSRKILYCWFLFFFFYKGEEKEKNGKRFLKWFFYFRIVFSERPPKTSIFPPLCKCMCNDDTGRPQGSLNFEIRPGQGPGWGFGLRRDIRVFFSKSLNRN